MENPSILEATLDEQARRGFEAAWRSGRPETIERFLPAPTHPQYLLTLAELVQIDMELAWKAWGQAGATAPLPDRVETYLVRYPGLRQPELVRPLIEQELRVRQRHGDRPTLDDYRQRFPELADTLHSLRPTLPGPVGGPPPTPPPIPGYEIFGKLGSGAMGVVYKARQIPLDRIVALKMILGGATGAEDRARFHREAEAAAQLQHPHIVQVYEVGERDGQPYCALEYLEGGSLHQRIAGTPQPAAQAAAWVEALARAMSCAHRRGVIHRDLKPANILLTPDGLPKVTDFGLAKRLEGVGGLTQTGAVLGTPSYMAPEQAVGRNKEVGPPADIYALGAILYELLTGRPPFKGPTLLDTLLQVATEEPVPPRRLSPKVPRDLETICLKCLEKEPARRYATAEALAEDCAAFLKGEPIQARPSSLWDRGGKWVRRRPALAGLLAVSTLALLGLIVGGVVYHAQLETAYGKVLEEQGRTSREAEKNRRQLVGESLNNGWRQADAGDLPGALPWFAEALRLDRGDPERELPHRIRLAAVRKFCPPLVQVWAHDGAVRSAVFSPDGSRILTASMDRTARLWDAATGQPLLPPFQHEGPVSHAVFSPDGKRVATTSYDHTARLWDSATGQPLTPPLKHSQPVNHAAFSGDGRRLITASGDWTAYWGKGEARVWDVESGRPVTEPLGTESVLYVALNPDGRRAVLTCLRGFSRVWDETKDKPLESLPSAMIGPRPSKVIRYGAFSSDGGRLLRPQVVSTRLRDLDKPDAPEVSLAASGVKHAAFSPDGRRVVTAGWDWTVRVWDPATGQETGRPMPHASGVYYAAFSPDGSRIVTLSEDYRVGIWDAAKFQPLCTPLQHGSTVHHAAFSPDGRRLVTACEDRTVRVWEIPTSVPLGRPLAEAQPINQALFSSEGGRVLLTGPGPTTRVWSSVTGQPLTPVLAHPNGGSFLACSRDGTRVLTAFRDPNVQGFQAASLLVQAWDVVTGKALGPPLPQPYSVTCGAFSADGSRAVTACCPMLPSPDERPLVSVWDVATGKPNIPALPHEKKVVGAAFSSDGRRLLTISGDVGQAGEVRIWDAVKGAELFAPLRHTEEVSAASFSSDGSRVLTASLDRTARLWHAATGQPLTPPLEHTDEVVQAAFSADGSRVWTVCYDRTVRVWSADTGQPLTRPLPHRVEPRGARFSSDGRFLLTISAPPEPQGPGEGRVWEAATGVPLTPPLPHGAAVADGIFSRDGRQATTATLDARIWVWDLTPAEGAVEELIEVAEVLSGRRVDATGSLVPLDAITLQAAWEKGGARLRISPTP